MRAGSLNRRIIIRDPKEIEDAEGHIRVRYKEFARCWALIEPASGVEQLVAGQVEARRPVTLTIRYRRGVRPRQQVLYGDRILEVFSVVDLSEDHTEIQLICTELDV